MSLARTLMNGPSYGEVPNDVLNMVTTYESDVYDSTEYTDIAIESAYCEIFDIQKAVDVADVMGEVSVIKEGADPAVLYEGIISDTFTKIKNALAKLWAKIKAWFKKVLQWIKTFFLNDKEFIKEYENMLTSANVKDFEYEGKEYKFDAGKSTGDKLYDKAKQALEALIDEGGKIVTEEQRGLTIDEVKDRIKKFKDKDFMSEIATSVDSKLSGKDVAGVKKALRKKYTNDVEKTFKNFSGGNSVGEMIDFIKDYNDKYDAMKESENDIDDLFEKVNGAIDDYRGSGSDENKSLNSEIANLVYKHANTLLAYGKAPCDVYYEIIKEAKTQFSRVLRSYARYISTYKKKGVGESYSGSEGGTSLLEQAMNFI